MVVHRLLKKDVSTLTAECSECGLVAIRKAGNGFQCATKKALSHKAWANRNPEKAAANRRQKSEHALFARDYVKLTAECVRCGPVQMVAYGRGYTCGNRSRELRTNEQPEPQRYCPDCMALDGDRVWLRANGSCPRCTDNTLPVYREDDASYQGAGFSIHYSDDYEDDYLSAVPGWRVIGSERPWNEV